MMIYVFCETLRLAHCDKYIYPKWFTAKYVLDLYIKINGHSQLVYQGVFH